MLRIVRTAIVTPATAIIALGATTVSAWAGIAVGVPGPLAGVGLPALAVGACGYWIYRRVRDRSGSE